MEEKDLNQVPGALASSKLPTIQTRPTPGHQTNKSISKNTSMATGDDDEEEEGMLKVDEEGQIEEDEGANHQVSRSRSNIDRRPISLADRLTPLADTSFKNKGTCAPSNISNAGYVSPRHAISDREHDRDRYHETSPAPSSSYTPQRPRFGYSAETGSSYGAASAFPYARESHRSESYASGSRNGFSGPGSRADSRRGWYASPTAATSRAPDNYRPGANRERDRDWESFRDGDRDRDWSTLERERERDGYRHSSYPASTATKYGFDNREFAARRAASPSPSMVRDREFDTDRSRDRDSQRSTERDPRIRASSSSWGSGGMRQWGKPLEAGIARQSASDDARSDTSQRLTGSRSNYTPPPAGSSEAGTKPSGSDFASEKSEARSREVSYQTTNSPDYRPATDTNKVEVSKSSISRNSAPSTTSASASPATKLVQDAGQATKASESRGDMGADVAHSAPSEFVERKNTETVEAPLPSYATTLAADALPHDVSRLNGKEKPGSDQYAQSEEKGPVATTQEHKDSSVEPAEQPVSEKSESILDPAHSQSASHSAQETAKTAQISTSTSSSEIDVPAQPNLVDALSLSISTATQEQADTEPSSTVSASASGASDSQAAAPAAPATTTASGAEVTPTTRVAQSVTSGLVDESTETDVGATASNAAQDEGSDLIAITEFKEASEVPVKEEGMTATDEPVTSANIDSVVNVTLTTQAPVTGSSNGATSKADASVLPPHPTLVHGVSDSIDTPDALQQEQTDADAEKQEPPASPQAEVVAKPEIRDELNASVTVDAGPLEAVQPPTADSEATGTTGNQQSEVELDATDVPMEGALQEQDQALVVQADIEQVLSASTDTPTAQTKFIDTGASGSGGATAAGTGMAKELAFQPTEPSVKSEEDQAVPISDVSMTEAAVGSDPVDTVIAQELKVEIQPEESAAAPDVGQAAPNVADSVEVKTTEAQAGAADTVSPSTSQIQVSGQFVTATIDTENETQKITLPHVDYGEDKKVQSLVEQESARIEEVEMPEADQPEPSLRIAQIDEAAKDIEQPLMTPTTQEQIDQAIHAAVRQHFAIDIAHKDDWKSILRENQLLSQKTTMDVLKTKIHGIPQHVSSNKPLWLQEDDDQAERTKTQLFSLLLDRKKRLNEKVEALKKRYRSINEEWKVHCSRLDRAAERREMLRRPPANTPTGTPGAFGVEDPSPGGGLLSASLITGRPNRRSAQSGGFAGFGDAVRSEAEFLEILASLENADMQDPNMRAARTTATAPDMYIDPDSDQLMKLRYDDVNGFVADPLAFYLDEFDPDVWSDEEKAIFARRYALWPKQFGKIAQALPHKTPAQCVRYYYLNKKVPGNDFKALAAARNRERKRKARVKPKKAKGSALMADLKSAKGEEVDDVEDGSGLRSPVEALDPSGTTADVPMSANGRRGGGRNRVVSTAVDGSASAEDAVAGRKRTADQSEVEPKGSDPKTSDKRKPGPKSKRAKSDNASGGDKSRKSRPAKKDSATLDEAKPGASSAPSAVLAGNKLEATDESALAGAADGDVAPAEVKPRVEDSDLAAAEALGALAGLFGGAGSAGDSAVNNTAPGTTAQPLSSEADAEGRKAGKKRRGKTAALGDESSEITGSKGRGKQPTSSYWSVAERYEFLRALVVHGPRWEVVSSTLAQKSTAQARNYFARNEDETDFAEAAALARYHADAPLEEREKVALAFVRQRFANSSASALPASTSSGPVPGHDVARITHLPPPPGILAGQADTIDVKVREASPESAIHRRGLQINSLLNDTNEATIDRGARRLSLHAWQAERGDLPSSAFGRDGSVPPSLYARQTQDLEERRPLTADRIDGMRSVNSETRSSRDDFDDRARAYGRLESHRPVAESRDAREEGVDSRSWMYDSPYEARRRVSPTTGYAAMAPPSHPADRGMPASRYSMPPSGIAASGHMARSVPHMPSHLGSSEDIELERERERYGMYGPPGRSREHESQSMPPAVSGELRHASTGEQISPTNAQFGASHGYSRYSTPGVSSLYVGTTAAPSAVSSRGRSANGPLTAPLPSSTPDGPAYEQRWQRYSQSPGPAPAASAGGHAPPSSAGGFSAGSAYRSSNSAYSSFPSQSLPRPSLPSLSSTSGSKVGGAPYLPSLGAAGRSLPPLLGTFPAPSRSSVGPGSRPAAGTGEEAASRYWPYPHRPRGPEQPPHNRNAE